MTARARPARGDAQTPLRSGAVRGSTSAKRWHVAAHAIACEDGAPADGVTRGLPRWYRMRRMKAMAPASSDGCSLKPASGGSAVRDDVGGPRPWSRGGNRPGEGHSRKLIAIAGPWTLSTARHTHCLFLPAARYSWLYAGGDLVSSCWALRQGWQGERPATTTCAVKAEAERDTAPCHKKPPPPRRRSIDLLHVECQPLGVER